MTEGSVGTVTEGSVRTVAEGSVGTVTEGSVRTVTEGSVRTVTEDSVKTHCGAGSWRAYGVHTPQRRRRGWPDTTTTPTHCSQELLYNTCNT